MKILKLSWNSYGNQEIEKAFSRNGLSCVSVPFDYIHDEQDRDNALELVKSAIRDHGPDAVFMFNYSRIVARVCRDEGITYLSWVYDSPVYRLRSEEILYPTNRIMLFDSYEVEELKALGAKNVYWLPLACDPKAIQSVVKDNLGKYPGLDSQVTFVGRFYGMSKGSEQYYRQIVSQKKLNPFWHGYLEGLMACQHKVYGENLIRKCMDPDVVGVLKDIFGENPDKEYESDEYRFTNLLIGMELSARERIEYISALADHYPVTVYTLKDHPDIPGVDFRDPIDSRKQTPVVANRSKVNLNITLRTIKNGVPLRVFEILAAGGFMLSNYQSDMASLFRLGEELVTFDSTEDLVRKCGYYLEHEDERREIADNGLKAVSERHTYEQRVAEMVSLI